jgi:hypothetical protein
MTQYGKFLVPAKPFKALKWVLAISWTITIMVMLAATWWT